MTTRMNFGAGSIQPAGWIHVDKAWDPPLRSGRSPIVEVLECKPGSYDIDIRGGMPLPWHDRFDYVVAHCSLQELTHHELVPALKELLRVLKPNGYLRVSVPDMRRAIQALVTYDPEWFPQGGDLTDIDERFCTYVTWFGTSRSVFTQPYMSLLFERAGFIGIETMVQGATYCSHREIVELDARPTECMFIEGRKP